MMRKTAIVVLILAAVGTLPARTAALWYLESQGSFELVSWSSVHRRLVVFIDYRDDGDALAPEIVASYVVVLPRDNIRRMPWAVVVLGIGYSAKAFANPSGVISYARSVHLPFWVLGVSFAAYPAFDFVHGPLRRYCRRKRGRCMRCGYDLTGLTKPRCPECGTEIESP